MEKTVAPMTEGVIWKRITFFALPIFLGNLFQQLYNTVDSLIVGNFVGHTALAAVSSSGSLIFMLVGFLSGLASGAGVVIANFYGTRDDKNVETAVHTTVALGIVASIVMSIVGVFMSPVILKWMQTPDNVMPESVEYLQIYFAGSAGVVMYNIFVGVLQAIGDSRRPLYYLIVSSVVNLVLDLVFINVFHMGVAGAAWATVISQVISAVLCLIRLLRTKECYRLSIKKIRFDMRMLAKIIRIGLPSGVQNSIIAFANVIVQFNINTFGDMAMAGIGSYSKIEGFAFLPITSFTMALTTFIGQNLGAHEYERAKKGARFGIVVTVVLAEVVGLFVYIFAPQLIAAFDRTPEVIGFGVDKSRSNALFYFLLAYSHCIAAILRGSGKAVVPMLVMMVFWCIVRVTILSIVVPLTNSIQIVYWVYPITWGLSSAAFMIYYYKSDWLGKKKRKAEAAAVAVQSSESVEQCDGQNRD